jgi:predicted membrane-bound dolichyl-phosphate-mannose-protein mannosyltransferase
MSPGLLRAADLQFGTALFPAIASAAKGKFAGLAVFPFLGYAGSWGLSSRFARYRTGYWAVLLLIMVTFVLIAFAILASDT